jgi:hypothetical protein
MWNVNAFTAFTQQNSPSAIITLFVKGVFQAKLWKYFITAVHCALKLVKQNMQFA